MRRPRGPGGRFLTAQEIAGMKENGADAEKKDVGKSEEVELPSIQVDDTSEKEVRKLPPLEYEFTDFLE